MYQFKITDLEALADKAEQLANMALALEGAMFEGPNSADEYGASMNLFVNLMLAHSKEMLAFFTETHASRKIEVAA